MTENILVVLYAFNSLICCVLAVFLYQILIQLIKNVMHLYKKEE